MQVRSSLLTRSQQILGRAYNRICIKFSVMKSELFLIGVRLPPDQPEPETLPVLRCTNATPDISLGEVRY